LKNYFFWLSICLFALGNLRAADHPEATKKFDLYKEALKLMEAQKSELKITYPVTEPETNSQRATQSYFSRPLENSPLCRMCDKEKADLAIIPCGHTFGQHCLKDNIGIAHCPECHIRIREFLTIFQ
jgi:hypothetical protein